MGCIHPNSPPTPLRWPVADAHAQPVSYAFTMDYARLRNLLEPLVAALKDAGTHPMLPTICGELGMPAPASDGSKRERMTASFDAVADTDLPAVARKLLVRHPPSAATRNQIQDLLHRNHVMPYPYSWPSHRNQVRRGTSGGTYPSSRADLEFLLR